MQIFEKELADTDSIYCKKPTNSHQSSIFIGPTDGHVSCGLFGDDYVSDMDVVLELSRDNLLLNILYHFLSDAKYKRRGPDTDWVLDKNWLLEKQGAIRNVFNEPITRFHVSLNKETTRTYLKGISDVRAEGGSEKIDLRNYLFSGDVLRMCRKNDGVVAIAIAGRGGEAKVFSSALEKFDHSRDVLETALKLFQQGRLEKRRDGWESWDAWSESVRAAFAEIDAAKFIDAEFYSDFMVKYALSRTTANAYLSKNTEDERREMGNYLSQAKVNPQAVSWYIDKSTLPNVKGMEVASALYFMMELHPTQFCPYTRTTVEVCRAVGLTKDAYNANITIERYEAAKVWQGRIMQRMHEMGIGKTAQGGGDADYLTVNVFTWWFANNWDRGFNIKEKMMNMQMKKDKPTKFDEAKRKPLKFDPASKDDELLLRLLASLRAKPFAILAGHSGTGKSRYVKKLAYMMCNANELRHEGQLPGNFLLLQVKPNWHDSTDLLGFRNAMDDGRYQKTPLIEFMFRAYHNPETPFFLCLDEMNLAPVEQYFAEFLSAMESEEPVPLNDISENDNNLLELGCEWLDSCEYLKTKKFSIPKNLFIVGTVNMDETTNQFSRKVLDRAFTIEMTDVDFRTFDGEHDAPPSYKDTIEETKIKELLNGEFAAEKLDDDDRNEGSALIGVQKKLEQTPFAIAYRFASEYTLLKRALKVFDAGETKIGLDALDQAVLMKILPRIAGESDYIKKIYGEKEDDGLRGALKGKTASLKKIGEILDRATETGAQYITFWP